MIYFFDKSQNLIHISEPEMVLESTQEAVLGGLVTHFAVVGYDAEIKDAVYFGVKDVDDHSLFVMYRIDELVINTDTIELTGIHVFFDDLKGVIIEDIRPTDQTAPDTLARILSNTGWSVGSSTATGTASSNFYFVTALEAFWEFLGIWDVEYKLEMTFSNGKITSKKVNLADRFAPDYGKWYEKGDELLSIIAEESHSEVYTAFIGRGKGEEKTTEDGDATGGYGRKITFEEVIWSKADNHPLDKPWGQKYLEFPEATELYGYPDGSPRVRILEFSEITDPNELIVATYEEGLHHIAPKVQMKSEVAPMERAELGEMVAVIDEKFRYKTRIFKMKRDFLANYNKIFEFGERIVMSSTERINHLAKEQGKQRREFESMMQEAISIIQDWYWGEDGYNYDLPADNAYGLPGGFYSFDRPIDHDPTKVIYVGAGKLLIANSKAPNGEWIWQTAATADGLAGDAIIANSITANKLASDVGRSLDLSSNTSINSNVTKLVKQYIALPEVAEMFKDEEKKTYIAFANSPDGIEDFVVMSWNENLLFNSEGIVIDKLGSPEGAKAEHTYYDVGNAYMDVEEGQPMTISFDLVYEWSSQTPLLQVYNTNRHGPVGFTYDSSRPLLAWSRFLTDFFPNFKVGETLTTRLSIPLYFNRRESYNNPHNWIEFYSGYDSNNFYRISNLKVELGHEATPWQPHSSEVQDRHYVGLYQGLGLDSLKGNKVRNSNFEDGDYWASYFITLRIADNSAHLTYSNNGDSVGYPNMRQNNVGITKAEDKYYVSFEVYENNNTALAFFQTGGKYLVDIPEGFNGKLSTVYTPTTDDDAIYFNSRVYPNEILDYKIKNVYLVNLTEEYGAGNEPTKEYMDSLPWTPAPADILADINDPSNYKWIPLVPSTITDQFTDMDEALEYLEQVQVELQTQILQTEESISLVASSTGGANFLLNSVGMNGLKHWTYTGSVEPHKSSWIMEGQSRSGFRLGTGTLSQNFTIDPAQEYTLMLKARTEGGVNFAIKLNGEVLESGTTVESKVISVNRTITGIQHNELSVEVTAISGTYLYLTDIGIFLGIGVVGWSQAIGEYYSNTVKIDIDGIELDEGIGETLDIKSTGFIHRYGERTVFRHDLTGTLVRSLEVPPVKFNDRGDFMGVSWMGGIK